MLDILKVLHIQRKKTIYFSVENLFNNVRKNINNINISLKISSRPSSGFINRIINIMEILNLKFDVNHVLGDIHYLSIFLNKKNTILTVLDCITLHQLKGLKYYIIFFFWYYFPVRRLNHITVISSFVRDELVSFTNCNPNKISVIHCCISDSFFSSIKKSTFNKQCPSILVIGTTPNKNLNRIVKSLKNINCKLIIVGNLNETNKNFLTKQSISYENLFNLSEKELINTYLSSDILLFASLYEGFGLPIIEANALGIPVITSNITSMPEISADAACLVNPMDVKCITFAVKKIISDDNYRLNLVKKGFNNCTRFKSEVIAKQYENLYNDVYYTKSK